MAWVTAYLPGDQAAAIWNRTTAISRGLQGPAEQRTLTQLRADVFAAALLTATDLTSGDLYSTDLRSSGDPARNGSSEEHDPGQVPSPRAQVLVTVPVFSLLGATEEPAMLDGYGPIPASMARDLVANGAESFHRVLIDPRDGAPLEIGRTSYRLTKAMRQWLRLRDGKCPFPGCSNNSLDNEADHLLSPGPTAAPPEFPTWDKPAPNTTGSGTPAPGGPPSPPATYPRAGSHRPAGTTKANTRTGNHPTGPTIRTASTLEYPWEKRTWTDSSTPGPDTHSRGHLLAQLRRVLANTDF
jgi:hypothetical protein